MKQTIATGDTTPLYVADPAPTPALAVRFHSAERDLQIVYHATPRRHSRAPALLIGAVLAFVAGGISAPLGFVVLLCIVLLAMLLQKGHADAPTD